MSLDIDIVCSECGNNLDGNWSSGANNYTVDPCQPCIEEAREEAMDKGYENRLAEEAEEE